MTKKYFILALAAFTMAACNNDEEGVPTNGNAQVGEAINPVLLYMAEGTRESMSVDLVNTWVDGDAFGIFSQWDKNSTKDSSLYVNNGMQNARYQYYNSFEYNGQKYTKRWAQDGLLDKTLTPANTVQWAPESKYVDTPYNFYVYFPYTAGATQTAVPFTLKSEQTQTTPDEWSNAGSSSYNFLYSSNKNVTRPADRALPLNMERLLPVAEFNIIRDDESLDDYTLSSVVVKPTSGTMKTGVATINLDEVATYSTISLGEEVAQYQLNCGEDIKVNDIAVDNSASVYMSLPPADSKEYTITATFSNGTDTKVVKVTRTDAYTIEKGKGNIVKYYFKSSKAASQVTTTHTNFKTEYTQADYFMWDAYQPYQYKPSTKWGPNSSNYNSVNGTTDYDSNIAAASCMDAATLEQVQMYIAAGYYYDNGEASDNQMTYKLPDGKSYHNGFWLKKKAFISGFDAGTAPKIMTATSIKGRPDAAVINQYFFLPIIGYYDNVDGGFVSGYDYGEFYCDYWLRDAVKSNNSARTATSLSNYTDDNVTNLLILTTWRYFGYPIFYAE